MKIIIMYLRERHIMNYEFASVVNSLRHGRNRKHLNGHFWSLLKISKCNSIYVFFSENLKPYIYTHFTFTFFKNVIIKQLCGVFLSKKNSFIVFNRQYFFSRRKLLKELYKCIIHKVKNRYLWTE